MYILRKLMVFYLLPIIHIYRSLRNGAFYSVHYLSYLCFIYCLNYLDLTFLGKCNSNCCNVDDADLLFNSIIYQLKICRFILGIIVFIVQYEKMKGIVMKSDSLKENIIYQGLYQLIRTMTPLTTTPIISRAFGPSGVGIVSFSFNIVILLMIASVGVFSYISNRVIAKSVNDKRQLSLQFGISLSVNYF